MLGSVVIVSILNTADYVGIGTYEGFFSAYAPCLWSGWCWWEKGCCGGGRGQAHLIPGVACPPEDFVVDATLLFGFAALGRAGFFGGGGGGGSAGPLDSGTQLVLCLEQPLRKAAELLGLCLDEEGRSGCHFDVCVCVCGVGCI